MGEMKMSNDEFPDLAVGFFVGAVFMLIMTALLVFPDYVEISHKNLGSKDHVCFANHTCRENLKCVWTDGLEPWAGVCK